MSNRKTKINSFVKDLTKVKILVFSQVLEKFRFFHIRGYKISESNSYFIKLFNRQAINTQRIDDLEYKNIPEASEFRIIEISIIKNFFDLRKEFQDAIIRVILNLITKEVLLNSMVIPIQHHNVVQCKIYEIETPQQEKRFMEKLNPMLIQLLIKFQISGIIKKNTKQYFYLLSDKSYIIQFMKDYERL